MLKKYLSLLLYMCAALSANAQTQITNGDFEGEWENCYPWEKGSNVSKAYGTQPTGWCVSNVPNDLVTESLGSKVDGYNSTSAVQIKNTSAAGNGIPGYMTLGTTWATAETKMTSTRNKDGGVFGGVSFTHRPDAISLVYKRDNSASTSDVSTVVVYTWKGSVSQEEVPSNTAVGIFSWGSATKVTMTNRDNNILGVATNTGGTVTYSDDFALLSSSTTTITGSAPDWTTLNIHLDYKDATVAPEMMNVVISAAGYHDGGATITDGVSLTVDDVKFVYYHALSSLSYEGATINFDECTTFYDLSNVVYDASKLKYTVKGVAANATTSYNEETGVLTIHVVGEDATYTDYTIQFSNYVAPQIVSTKTYTEDLYVTVDGMTVGPQEANVVVDTYDDGTINFTLKNFVLASMDAETGESTNIYVGNIAITGITFESDNTFKYNGNIQITVGDDPADAAWYGPMLGDIPVDMNGHFGDDNVVVLINISMLGQEIEVNLGQVPSGINGVNADSEKTDAIYDIAGRRVTNATKGIFIINGKKVLR